MPPHKGEKGRGQKTTSRGGPDKHTPYLRDIKVPANSNPISEGNIYNDVMVALTPQRLFQFKSTHLGC